MDITEGFKIVTDIHMTCDEQSGPREKCKQIS